MESLAYPGSSGLLVMSSELLNGVEDWEAGLWQRFKSPASSNLLSSWLDMISSCAMKKKRQPLCNPAIVNFFPGLGHPRMVITR